MDTISGLQRRFLRGAAHGLKPAVHLGKEGLTGGVVDAIDASLTAHELIKVKLLADRDGRSDLIPEIERRLGCECVGSVGHMAILYRRHPDPEQQTIRLPG